MFIKMTKTQNERRKRILESAGIHFGKMGYYAADVDVIAKEAGVGKGTLYRYFANKEELFFETVSHFSEKMYSEIVSKIEKVKMERFVEALFEAHEDYYSRHKETYKLVAKAVSQMPEKLVMLFHQIHRQKMEEIHKKLENGVEKGVFKKINTEIMLKMLDAMANIIFLTKESGTEYDTEEIKTTFKTVFNNGLIA